MMRKAQSGLGQQAHPRRVTHHADHDEENAERVGPGTPQDHHNGAQGRANEEQRLSAGYEQARARFLQPAEAVVGVLAPTR